MTKYIEVTGKTEDEALRAGLEQLGLTRDEVSVEVLERAKHGFLGLGSSPAKLRLSYEEPEPELETVPVPVPEPEPEPEKPAAKLVEKPKKEAKRKPEARPEPKLEPKLETKPEAAAPSSDAAAGDKRERVERYLRGLLELMGVEAEMEFSERENGGLNVSLSGPGMGAVIGRRGETLDAIQHLVNYTVNRGGERRAHISVDAENYRQKREESLIRLAEKMAGKAVKYHRSMALEPMNSYERHVIHTALQNYEGVSTASVGTEPNRRVVISCERPASGSKPQSREWA